MASRIPQALAVLGAGSMAEAILRGALASEVLDPTRVFVADPAGARREVVSSLGLTCFERSEQAVRSALATAGGQVLLAVKPQSFAALADEIRPLLTDARTIVVSILAGTPSRRIADALGANVAIVRAMPNTPALVGMATTGISLGVGSQPGDEELAFRLFGAIGPLVERVDESLMDAMTAVVGSGPAFVFYLTEAMRLGAQRVGFSNETADRLVRSTVRGAAELLARSADSDTALRARVTSKSGTTEAAMQTLDAGDVAESIAAAIVRARDRGEAIARG